MPKNRFILNTVGLLKLAGRQDHMQQTTADALACTNFLALNLWQFLVFHF
jgi:hypothetical protein